MTRQTAAAGGSHRQQVILWFTSFVGMTAFLYPFLFPPAEQGTLGSVAHAADAPIVLGVLLLLMVVALLAYLSSEAMSSKDVAVLSVLAAVSAVLRLVPAPGGATAVFFLPIIAGYIFGPSFGFLCGSSTLLVSALIGGGIGPWLPYQMFATGWVGASPGLLPRRPRQPRLEVALLAVVGFLLGLLYGALMNLWFWPFVFQPQSPGQYWQPGMALLETLKRYALFYLATSFWWDALRGIGNVLLIVAFGGPVLRQFRRFQRRFYFRVSECP